jgi:signal transduction histidine kinase
MSLSVNYLTLANATFLISLACFLLWRSQSKITRTFFAINVAMAVWNVCFFVVQERLFFDHVAIVIRIQMLATLVFSYGLHYFCSNYPATHRSKSNWLDLINKAVNWLNNVVFAGFIVGILHPSFVTSAAWVNDEIVYQDGPGFLYFVIYMSALSVLIMSNLMRTWLFFPEHRARTRYVFIGIFIFLVIGVTFNLVLPGFFGNNNFLIMGRLATTFASVFFFYAIAKHDFLDINVIINRGGAWATTLAILLAAAQLLNVFTREWPALNSAAIFASIIVASLYAYPLQQFLLTTAKRKFIRGWYSTEEVINRLSGKITLEKSREAIFKEVTKVLDEVFELEDVLTIIAVRDEHEAFSYYKIVGKFQKIKSNDPLIEKVSAMTDCMRLEEAPAPFLARLKELGFARGDRGIMLPFHSPEFLEGIIFLGERSSQVAYSESDMRFFTNLINFLSPILYRLTPLEKLEQLYGESRQKLHEAEIQLIRAQKIESIVHATRQCHHEIRTPLNIIRLGIGRIKTLQDLDAYKEVAREEIDHALEIVEETLTITEVDKLAGTRAVDININEVIQRCLRLIDRTRYNVVLDLGELPEIPAVFSDMQVVMTNLIHNAIEAMPNGGAMAFTTRVNASDVVITVEDSGEGIPEKVRPRVWEPYFSGRGSDVGNSNAGRGWGLTIVNRIITAHQGTIRFTSEEKVGTRFVITLPRKKGHEENQKGSHLSQVYP